jgi:hypothetical protein
MVAMGQLFQGLYGNDLVVIYEDRHALPELPGFAVE